MATLKSEWFQNFRGGDDSDNDSFDGEGNVERDLKTPVRSNYVVRPSCSSSDNVFTELTLIDEDFLPSQSVANADDKSDGVFGNTPHLLQVERLKAVQVARENEVKGNVGFTIKWDEDPASIISTLEGCGAAPTLLDDRKVGPTMRKAFDPKAPHFDVLVVNLLDSPFFPQDDMVSEGVMGPTPLDGLPVSSLLGRPGFVIMHVGGAAVGRREGMRLFGVWQVKSLETVTWLPEELGMLHPNQGGSGLFRPSCEHWLFGIKGNVSR